LLPEPCFVQVGLSLPSLREEKKHSKKKFIDNDMVTMASGILLLQEHHWTQVAVQSTEAAERHTFSETRNAFDTLYRIALFLKQGSETQLPLLLRGQCTFFLASVVYHASSALMTIGRGDPSAAVREKIEAFGWLLGFLGERWPLSGNALGSLSTPVFLRGGGEVYV
jgi:hypothetical protein